MTDRRRMSPAERRAGLLDAGSEMFATSAFDDTSMDDIADAAGVTRRLLYHYFPTKADFFGAIWQRAHADLRTAVSGISAETVRELIEKSLIHYFDFYAANLPLVVIANRSPIATDPAVRGPVDADFARLCARFLDATGTQGGARSTAEVGFGGWIAFVRTAALASLVDRAITRETAHELCMDVLDAAVGRHVDLTTPLRSP